MKVRIIGGGLAGSEAAWQAAKAGVKVELFEMRPEKSTGAHQTADFAELVCSNSLRAEPISNAVGLLKQELLLWNSLIIESALVNRVPAGGALAVDRKLFSLYITDKIKKHPLITVISEEVVEIPTDLNQSPLIIASGPLTSPSLSFAIQKLLGAKHLAFYDAISPIIIDESINHTVCFRASRYGKGDGEDYLNIPLNKEQYYTFVQMVCDSKKHDSFHEAQLTGSLPEKICPFEGCMPIEDMAARGADTLMFGPLKPVGLIDPKTGKQPYAVIQLRHDDAKGTMWNMVGMQTRMTHPEQLRIFRSLPGLEEAEFVRLGSVHRNSFINSPQILNNSLEVRNIPGLFFAGQITGTEGYVESTAGGLIAGINAVLKLRDKPLLQIQSNTAIGALLNYISEPDRKNFQPMNISFGLISSYFEQRPAGKKLSKLDWRLKTAHDALAATNTLVNDTAQLIGYLL